MDSSASVVICFNVLVAFEGTKGDVSEAVMVVLDVISVITLGSCLVFGAAVNVASLIFGCRARCSCLVPVVCVGFLFVCNGAIARCRIFAN